ncbi:PVC-type heme-binding CxxCH protein [Singulisphaera sp. PoT]|uniref:PVC-type heme-binding CxxCH protein n=1 Tax=Singulisphaera sp. PoT TaxID=3411797 RepID=UPI003BF538F4
MKSSLSRLRLLLLAGLTLMGGRAGFAEESGPTPLSPAEEKAKFQFADPDLAIELVASEPDVISPVAVAWDEDGRMYVAEMIDYPSGPTGGRIRKLEDRDHDGKFDHISIFAEGLPYPTSVLPYKGGVLVTAAPNIWFFKDHDGDGRAEERKVILTGFGEGNTQLRVNGLTWGLDNWVYGANGRSDGDIRRPEDPPAKALALRHHDFRFRPDTGEVEAVTGFSQFGLPRDDWGDRYPSWNTIPFRHVVLEEKTLGRNPYLAESSSVESILDPADPNRVFSVSPTQARFNRESVAFFNASCGSTIYRGTALGKDYQGDAFVCESLLNLVHRRDIVAKGPTYLARRVEQGKEFLSSTDLCFRPVNMANGPDGALYLVDFYREMVEHPQFVPEDLRKAVDFRRWHDRGRIWRISSKDKPRTGDHPHLGRATSQELVADLAHPNAWWRDTAQRLIVERHDLATVPALSETLKTSANSLARLHAIWTLNGLGDLNDTQIRSAFHDAEPRIREAAARLASGRPKLVDDLITLADDPEVRVRFQAAIVLGDIGGDQAAKALAKIAARDASDDWVRIAVLSGLRDIAGRFLEDLLAQHPDWLATPTPEQGRLLSQTASILGVRRKPEEIKALASFLTPGHDDNAVLGRIALLAGLADGLSRSGPSLHDLLFNPSADLQPLTASVNALLHQIEKLAGDRDARADGRVQAVQLLASCRPQETAALIPALLQSDQPAPVQLAAARVLASVGTPELGAQILGSWKELGTGTRREILAGMVGSEALAAQLVDAIEQDTIALTELDASSREGLRRIKDASVRKRAEVLLEKSIASDRKAVVQSYLPVLEMKGDAKRGEDLFAKNCQTCHQRRGKGNRVGPDLSGIAGRPPSALLNDILDPNKDVAPDYVGYLLVTTKGQVLTGLLAEETTSSLKLRRAEGTDETVLRSEIEDFRSSGRSLMPEGLEQTMGQQGIADLLEFLRQP